MSDLLVPELSTPKFESCDQRHMSGGPDQFGVKSNCRVRYVPQPDGTYRREVKLDKTSKIKRRMKAKR